MTCRTPTNVFKQRRGLIYCCWVMWSVPVQMQIDERPLQVNKSRIEMPDIGTKLVDDLVTDVFLCFLRKLWFLVFVVLILFRFVCAAYRLPAIWRNWQKFSRLSARLLGCLFVYTLLFRRKWFPDAPLHFRSCCARAEKKLLLSLLVSHDCRLRPDSRPPSGLDATEQNVSRH